jgi:hypothetical protein
VVIGHVVKITYSREIIQLRYDFSNGALFSGTREWHDTGLSIR